MSFLVINKSPSGAAVYYSGAYDDATGATGNGGKYETEAQAQNWDDVKFLNAASTSTLPTGGYSSTILFSSGYVIGGTTPIGDVRGEETGYAFQGSPTVYGLDTEVLYSGALYAVYSAGGTDKLTGKVGIGTTAGDFTNNGYYAGSFTTRDNHNFETVLDVDTGNLNLTGLGSGVYAIGEQVTLQTSLVDRIGESLTTVSSITNDSFVKSLKISILDEDRNLIYDGYKTNYTNPSFTFTKQENIDIFGSFTKNFGVRFTVENQDGETHDTDFLLYGNRLSIDKIYVSASGGTYLDENPDNDYGPPTGSISLGSERTEALEGFSHRLINTSGTTGAINFNITFDQTPNFTDYDNLLIFAKTGTSVFDTTTENLLGTFPLSQLKNQNIRVSPDDGVEEGEANFFKFVGSSRVGFYDELFTVGPYTIQPIQVGEDPILYNVGDQEIVSGNLSILGDGAGGLYALGASGTGEGNRLTGPGNLPYLLTGDAGTEADTLQTVTDRGKSTSNKIGIGTDSTYAPYNYLEVYGAAQIQDRTTSSDGTIQLGDQTNQTITYSSSEEALKLGAGISNLDFGFGGTVGIGSSNSIIIAAPGGVTISGGSPSTGSFVGGGTGHTISGHYDSIVAGSLNKISGGNLNFIGGGSGNDVNYSRFSSSLGGKNNDISGADFSVLLGGNTNLISGGNAHVIGGGDNNQISGDDTKVASTIVGGTQNKILSNTYSFIGAGATNTIYANNSVIGGGTNNIASGDSSVVFGGSNNQVLADYGVAAGRYSKVQAGHSGAFVLSDANTTETLSSGANTLTLNFKSGVYVDTDSGIYVNGNPVLTGASGFEGDTLQTVTDRGATTTNGITVASLTVDGTSTTGINIEGQGNYFTTIIGNDESHPTQSLAGGRIIGPAARRLYFELLGNDNTDHFRFLTSPNNDQAANFVAVHIGNDGRFGVNTNNPAGTTTIQSALDCSSDFNTHNKYALNLHNLADDTNESIGVSFGLSSDSTAVGAAIAHERKGSSSYGDLYFLTRPNGGNVTERMRIASDGNVGIGTDNPDSILHLDSDGATVLTIEADNDNNDEGDEAAIHLLTDGGLRTAAIAGGNATYETSASGNFNALNLQSNLIRFHTAPSQDFNLASEKMRLTPAGNLGIGTTNPQYNLEIYSGDLGLGVSSTGTAKLVLEGDIDNVGDVGNMDASIEFLHDAGAFGYRISSHNYAGLNALNFADNKNGTYTDILHLGTGGHVGIGTNSPNALLHVYSAGNGEIEVERNGGALINLQAQAARGVIGTDSNHELQLKTNAGVRMTIDTNGNVGIGTDNPTFRLDVEDSDSILAQFKSTTNKAGIFIQDDDTSAYVSVENNKLALGPQNGIHATQNLNYDLINYRLGIGTNSPARKLEVSESSSSIVSQFKSTAGTSAFITLSNTTASADQIRFGSIGNDLVLSTNYTERFRIDSAGNVGIGTTAPITRLVVNTPMNRGQTNPSGLIVTDSANGAMALELGVDRASNASYIESRHTGSNTNYTLLLNPSYGKVGVGTVSPTSKFEVGTVAYGTNSIAKFWDGTDGVEITNRGVSRQQIDFLGSNTSAINAKGSLFINYDSDNNGSNDSIQFTRNGADTAGTVDMVIKEGQVGIGTTDPSAQLTVSGDGIRIISTGTNANNGEARIGVVGNNSRPNLELGPQGNSDEFQIINGGDWRVRTTTTRDLAFGTNSTNAIYIEGTNQNVGIGTDIPAYKLEVDVANDDWVRFKSDDNKMGLILADNDTVQYLMAENSALSLGHQAALHNENLNIIDGGDVGIGTTTPSGKLHVFNTGNASGDIFIVDGSHGRLFNVSDETTGIIFSVNDAAGLPVLEVDSTSGYDKISIGEFGTNALVVSGSTSTFGGSVLGTGAGNRITNNGTPYLLSGDAAATLTLQDVCDNGNTTTTAIGIGTGSPQFKLDVVDSNGGALARFKDSDSSYDGIRIEGDTNGGSITNAGSFSSEVIYMQNSINAMRFYTNGQERVRIASYGTVGINQASPSSTYSLDVGGSIRMATAAPSLVLRETDSSNQEFSVFGLGGDFYVRDITQSTYPFKIEAGAGNDTLVLYSGAGEGRIGIGTNSPSLVTHIYFTGNNGLRVQSTASHSNIDVKSHNDYGAYLRFMDGSNRYWLVARSDDKLQFRPNATSLESASIYFDETGKVGIGSVSPTQKLDVAGAINIQDGFGLRYNNSSNISIVGSSSLGLTYTAYNQHFKTFDGSSYTEHMTIATGGNVGIGTNAPSGTLSVGPAGFVAGYTSSRATLLVGDTTNGAELILRGQSPRIWLDVTSAGTGQIFLDNADFNVLQGSPISEGDSRFFIKNNGDIGMGTTDPDVSLHISSSDAAPLKVERDGVNCSVHTKNNVDDVYFGVNSYRNAAIGHDLNQNLAPFQITTGGNVGIGTNNPDGPLHIEYNSSTARASVNNNNTVGLKVENTNSAGVAQIHLRAGDADAHILVEDVGSNASDMFFSVDGTEPAMTIKNAGDVGIGTTAPSGNLHVQNGASSKTLNDKADELVVESLDHGGISILTPDAKRGQLYFNNDAFLRWVGDNDKLSINTSASSTTIAIAESAGDTTFGGSVLGTGAGNRITNNGTPYLLSGDAAATLTLQDVTDNGNTTTTGVTIGSSQSPYADSDGNGGERKLFVDGGDLAIDGGKYIALDHSYRVHGYLRYDNSLTERKFVHYGYYGHTLSTRSKSNALVIRGDSPKIGFNESDPISELHLYNHGNSGASIMTIQNGSTAEGSWGGIQFINSSFDYPRSAIFSQRTGGAYNADLTFHATTINTITGAAYPYASERMRIKSDGNVGIGTNDPATYKLQLGAGGDKIGIDLSSGGVTRISEIELYDASDGSINLRTNNASTGGINFHTQGSQRVTIARGGNVGIGTTIPSNALDVVGHFSATSKSFLIDHPTKENKKLQYASLEGPENGVYVRGTTNSAVIELPDYWSALVHEDSITVVLTPIGKKQDLYIKSKSPETVMIGGVEGSYDYVVYGERKDIDRLEIEPDGN